LADGSQRGVGGEKDILGAWERTETHKFGREKWLGRFFGRVVVHPGMTGGGVQVEERLVRVAVIQRRGKGRGMIRRFVWRFYPAGSRAGAVPVSLDTLRCRF